MCMLRHVLDCHPAFFRTYRKNWPGGVDAYSGAKALDEVSACAERRVLGNLAFQNDEGRRSRMGGSFFLITRNVVHVFPNWLLLKQCHLSCCWLPGSPEPRSAAPLAVRDFFPSFCVVLNLNDVVQSVSIILEIVHAIIGMSQYFLVSAADE